MKTLILLLTFSIVIIIADIVVSPPDSLTLSNVSGCNMAVRNLVTGNYIQIGRFQPATFTNAAFKCVRLQEPGRPSFTVLYTQSASVIINGQPQLANFVCNINYHAGCKLRITPVLAYAFVYSPETECPSS